MEHPNDPKFGVLGFIRALRLSCLSVVTIVCLGTYPTLAQQALAQKDSTSGDVQSQPTFDQLESDAIVFVQEHHPELVSLLQSLKAMRQKEYEMAIRDIVRTKKRLETLSKRESEMHLMELDAWKLKSKIDLLVAKGIARDKSFDTAVLRELLKQQIENQKKRWKYEQQTLAKRQEQIGDLLSKIEGHEEAKVEQQLSTHLKNVDNRIGKSKKSKQELKTTNEGKLKP